MTLLEPYLRTLQLFLPMTQRHDIIRELSGEIEAQAAENEQELGRPLTLDEEAAVIGRYGHPLLTAARYRRQQHLVGPLVFPYFWLLLKVIMALVVSGHVIGACVLLAGGAGWAEINLLLARLVETSLKVVGWLTLIAAAADVWLTRSGILERWNPSSLIQHSRSVTKAGSRPDLLPRSARKTLGAAPTVSRFLVHAALGVWWLLALKFPILLFAGGADIVAWGPAMNRLYPVLAVAVVAALAQQLARLARLHDDRFSRVARVFLSVNSLFFFYLMLTSTHEWVVWSAAAEQRAHLTVVAGIAGREVSVDDLVNYAFSVAFTFAAVVDVAGTLKRFVRWFSGELASSCCRIQ